MFLTNTALGWVDCYENQLTDLSNFIDNPNFDLWDHIDIRYNNLSCDDWVDIITLKKRIGNTFRYYPQNSLDLYDCNINTPFNFPDPNFRSAIENFMGVVPDGIITAREAAEKTGNLICANQNISYMTGIDFFPSVDGIFCNNNQLTTLDISSATSLIVLSCNDNQLVNLEIHYASDLAQLDCSNNQLTNLDITH